MHKIERNSNIDKTKGLLIFLVVFGHFVERYMGWHGDLSGALLRFIYAVHMPAFIFISGMFFKFENWNVSKVTNMSNMFRGASVFNQDLSMWCVSNIPTMPTGFNTGAPFLVGAKLPVWGTCPSP